MPRQGKKTIGIGTVHIGSLQRRIIIPQPEKRPLHLRTRSFIKKELVRRNPWWWIEHRRGLKGRTKIGEDPREMRAIPHSIVKGTLPERIVFLWLIKAYFVVDIDFSFQSSLSGGRLELGGIVADFIFEPRKMILQVQGPTHDQFLRMRKDEEQKQILYSLGYEVVDIDDDLIYNEQEFEDEMRRILNMVPGRGRPVQSPFIWGSGELVIEPFVLDRLYSIAQLIYADTLQLIGENI